MTNTQTPRSAVQLCITHPQASEPTVKQSLTVAEQSAELDAGMAAQHYCRGLWGAARGHSDWRKVHEHFANGYKQGRYDESMAQGPDASIWDKYAPVQHEEASEPAPPNAEHCEHGTRWDSVCRSCDELPAPSTAGERATCGMCGYTGTDKDSTGQCPKCRWDELQPVGDKSLRSALNAMLTQFGLDEDEWSKPTFDQARAALLQSTALPVGQTGAFTEWWAAQPDDSPSYQDTFAAGYRAAPQSAGVPVGALTDEQRKAAAICLSANKVSVSMVQRTLNIGYNAAQELCQSIIDAGLVPGVGISPSLRTAAARSQPVRELLDDYDAKHMLSLVPRYFGDTGDMYGMRVFRAAEAAHGITKKGAA